MRKLVLLVLVSIISCAVFAQKRAYLIHTDANIDRLKRLIEKNEEIQDAWQKQKDAADQLIDCDRFGAADCQVLGLVYRMTGDDQYAEAIKKVLLDQVKKTTWEGSELLSRTPSWQGGLGVAHNSFFLSIGFDCAYNYLTPSERQEVAEGLARLGVQPQMHDWLNADTNIHTFDTMGHNWWSACVYIAGFTSLAIRNEVPEAERWLKEIEATAPEWFNYAGDLLQNKIPTFDRNGGFWESINYANFGVSQYLIFRLALNNVMPKFKQNDLPILDKVTDFFISTTYNVKDGKPMSVNFGDGHIDRNGNACAVLLWNLGYRKDRYAWYINQVAQGDDKEGLQLGTANGLILYPELPKLVDDYKPDLGKSFIYPDMGWATMRNSWSDNATMLAVKSGLTWNHAHADAGSYILFHKGKNLIIDSGNSSYGNPLYTEYYCQSEAHNVVLFNGEGESRKSPYFGSVNHASIHNLVDGCKFKYVLANATGPYSQNLDRNYRSFLWVGNVILVIDDLLAREAGKFEWLLHYNGESKRRGLDLSVKQEDAEVLVRPLYPETFPNGGLPHDFPEKMTLEERWGYEDHHPENRLPYWSVSHFEKTDRSKFITAIILKDEENKDNLPEVERFDGKDYLGVRITQNGETTEVYFNLLADGRIKHRNSIINMNGWETDAYLTAITFKEGAELNKADNIRDLFMTHGSYLRRDGQVLIHALSKYTAEIENFGQSPQMIFEGQSGVYLSVYNKNPAKSILVNDSRVDGDYDSELKLTKIKID
ncbi:heparinase II/III family protein [Mangrovibacterium marinum]|uniref:Heparinase II/III-like protein n=1 Tax=Mangrovibacterium marinum TaxID=1639118 RepID=A0A2T5C5D5_9BACT|nr:heparinase II/III family protein [Mangrovibacterium marinum]PTN10114.1 heparinase II/III-like protein [Mangrovibacterium marinum]